MSELSRNVTFWHLFIFTTQSIVYTQLNSKIDLHYQKINNTLSLRFSASCMFAHATATCFGARGFLNHFGAILMPEISRFCGIIIRMFPSDHPPPHFHAIYNEFDASISIETLQVITGSLPPRILGLVA